MPALSPFRRLVLIGLLTEAAYVVVLVRPFSLLRYYATPLLDLGKITNHQPWIQATIALVLVFLLYVSAYRTKGGVELCRVVLAFGILFSLTLVFVYPVGALDIFDYIFAGREMVAYGANPYLVMPQVFADDPFFAYVGWQTFPFTYGPLFGLLSGSIGLAAHDNLLLNLLLFKGVAVAAYVIASAMIYRLLQREAPERALAGVILFSWSPLVVFEVATNAHNDILVVLFVVAGLVAFAAGRRPLALASLALSVFTKFVTAPLALLWLVAGLRATIGARQRLVFLLSSAALVAVIGGLLYAPFLTDSSTRRTVLLAPTKRQEFFTSSVPSLFVIATRDRLGNVKAEAAARNISLLLLALFSVFQALRVMGTWQDLTRASYNVVLFYLLFLCPWFQPWYVMWVVPLAALLPGRTRAHVATIFSLAAMGKYLVYDFFWFSNAETMDTTRIEILAVAVIYVLPLAYLAAVALQSLAKRSLAKTTVV